MSYKYTINERRYNRYSVSHLDGYNKKVLQKYINTRKQYSFVILI